VAGVAGCGEGYGTKPAAATSADTAVKIVEMTDSTFAPNTVDLKVGETVSFVDKDEIAHTATAEGVFDSGTLRQGATFDFTATKPGTFNYVCIFHPGMTGKIVVS
jgi:plastocyanin